VWFYDMQADGYSLDDKRDKIDATDLPDIVAQWNKRHQTDNTDRTAKHFFVPVDEIVANGYDLSINRYKEMVYKEVEYEKPKAILAKLEKLEFEIQNDLSVLKRMI